MVFTEEDAENDGKVKREAGGDLHSVLARESGELYTKFREWCEENGRDPTKVLGDMLLRAIKDEGYAENIATTTIDLASLNRQQIRREDLELVNDLINEFAAAEEDGPDPIDQLIEQRLQAIGSGPMSGLQQTMDGMAQQNQHNNGVEKLERKIDSLERKLEDNETNQTAQERTEQVDESSGGSKKDIDDLFDDDGGDSSIVEVNEAEDEDDGISDDDAVSDSGVPNDVGPDVPSDLKGEPEEDDVLPDGPEDVEENTIEDVDEELEDNDELTFSSEDADE